MRSRQSEPEQETSYGSVRGPSLVSSPISSAHIRDCWRALTALGSYLAARRPASKALAKFRLNSLRIHAGAGVRITVVILCCCLEGSAPPVAEGAGCPKSERIGLKIHMEVIDFMVSGIGLEPVTPLRRGAGPDLSRALCDWLFQRMSADEFHIAGQAKATAIA